MMARLFRVDVERAYGPVRQQRGRQSTRQVFSKCPSSRPGRCCARCVTPPASLVASLETAERQRRSVRIMRAKHAGETAGVAPYTRTAATVLHKEGSAGYGADRRPNGGGPLSGNDGGRSADALRSAGSVHLPAPTIRPTAKRAHGGGVRHDHLPPPSREQLSALCE